MGNLFQLTGMESRYMLGHPVVLQHVKKCGLSSIIQTQEEEFAGLFP